MESVLVRYRNLIILVGVLFLQVLGLAVQVKRGSNDVERTRLIRIWAVSAITPFERVLVWAGNSTGNLWHNYVYLRGVRNENRELKERIEQMRLEQVRLAEYAAQAHRLQALLAFKEQFIAKTVAAQVIGTSGMDSSRIVYIDKGEDEGLKRDMAVITADGVVGKVWEVYPSVSKVLLINDQSSGVGAILEKSRLQGVLKGTATGEVTLERVMSDEQVTPGEKILSSGGDRIFPKGLLVGTVTKVSPGKDLFLNIRVKPAANLGRLEEVLVVTEKQERPAALEGNVRMRAADILAQRLPSVPDKPAVEAKAAEGAAAGSGSVKPPSAAAAGPRPAGMAAPAALQTGKNPGGSGHLQAVPGVGQPGKAAGLSSAAQGTAANAGSTLTGAKPAAPPGKPASPPAKPSSPQTNLPPPAGGSSPD
jgi:rod shape-determining protein MreC